jgi:site-specific DNA-cytosine methylase
MKVISLFSGAGGMDLGFIEAGFEIVWANDFDADACSSYRKNISDHIVYGDITKIPNKKIINDVFEGDYSKFVKQEILEMIGKENMVMVKQYQILL